jgi:hypothetical protein
MNKNQTQADRSGMVGAGVPFNRIRRITGYLVGDVNKRFNNAKRAEERERVKHGLGLGQAEAEQTAH